MASIPEVLQRHEHAIYGNGTPGLNGRVIALEKDSEEAKTDISEIKAKLDRTFWAALTGCAGIIATLIGVIYSVATK